MEAIETLFVPVVVFNNQPGKDAEVLKRYGEPAWNFQVVRYLDGEGKDIVPRKDRVWTTGATAGRMVGVLEKLGKEVPAALRALADGEKGAVLTVEREQKYYLQRSAYAGLEMSEAQRVKVNAALRFKEDPEVFLTREQVREVRASSN